MSPSFEASILHLIPDPLIWVRPVLDSNGTVEDFEVGYSNLAADKGINHPKGSLTGLRILRDGVPSPASAPGNFQHFLEVYSSGERKEYTFHAHHSQRVFETIRQPHEGGVFSLTRDRKAQREAEQREKETRRTMESIVQHSPNGILFYKAERNDAGTITDFRIHYYNDRSNELTGVTREQRETLGFRAILRLFNVEASFDRYVEVVETGAPYERELYLEGTNRWIISSMVKLDDGFLGMLSDITLLKNIEKQVLLEASRFETVVNASKAGMFTLTPVSDEEGTITDFRFGIVNQAVAAYIGQTAEVLKGALASIHFPAYKTNGLFEIYKECYTNDTTRNFDFHYEDGYDVFFNIDVRKMGHEVLVTFTDHTALKRLQRELEQKVEELRKININLEEFAHAASHDLKEPIRKIGTFTDRLKRSLHDRLTAAELALFARVENATERMTGLVEDLLHYSQVSIRPDQMKEVDLHERVKGVLHDLEVALEEKGAIVTVDPLPVVRGYGRQLQQLFQNLVSNALKYSKPGVAPQVHISSTTVLGKEVPAPLAEEEQNQAFCLIQVRDNGIGFEQQYAERIFQMFQRLHGRSEYAGTGVGLAIVRKVADNHGGYVTADSEPGKGATFNVYLPQ